MSKRFLTNQPVNEEAISIFLGMCEAVARAPRFLGRDWARALESALVPLHIVETCVRGMTQAEVLADLQEEFEMHHEWWVQGYIDQEGPEPQPPTADQAEPTSGLPFDDAVKVRLLVRINAIRMALAAVETAIAAVAPECDRFRTAIEKADIGKLVED
jgi:hypothetical protein